VSVVSQVIAVARSVVQLTFLLAIAAAIVMARTSSAAGAGPTTPDAMKATAADSLDAALRPGGSGISFEVVSVSTLHAKPDGPRIQLYTPDDPTKILGETDEYLVGTVSGGGGGAGGAFWMDRLDAPTKTADFGPAELLARVLEGDGKVWRDDGVGWYQVDDPPGVGMDPATARLLASMVRELGAAEKIDSARFDGRTLAGVKGTSGPDRWPGVVAAGGAAFTEKSFAVESLSRDLPRSVKLSSNFVWVVTEMVQKKTLYDLGFVDHHSDYYAMEYAMTRWYRPKVSLPGWRLGGR